MHLLGDVEEVFMSSFLRHLDGDESVIIDVFHESAEAISNLDALKLKLFSSYLGGLKEDEYGNVLLSTTTSTGEEHLLQLNYTHYQGRGATESKVEKIKREANGLKDKIIQCLQENIAKQNQVDTIVEFASCFDMRRKLTLQERVELLKKLYSIYGVKYIHEVESGGIPGWDIRISYEPNIKCTENEIVEQFETLWPKLNKEWVSWSKKKVNNFKTKAFWVMMMEQYGCLCTELFQLHVIICSISPGTGPLERAYSKFMVLRTLVR